FFHLVLVIICIPFLNPSLPYFRISIIETLFLANILHFINNIIPRTIMIGTQKLDSDGRNIIKSLKNYITDEERKAYFIIECNYLLKWKSYSELLKKSEEALSHWHDDIIFAIFKTLALPYLGKRDETLNILKDHIEFINKSPTKDTRNDKLNTEITKSILYNNLAYNILCSSHNSHQIK
ncbi:MAG: hypothetical protein JXJ04_18765, partial [Spirochaetales bacterium]|nr:hypothetical protein [Spirochaetales bacterium]